MLALTVAEKEEHATLLQYQGGLRPTLFDAPYEERSDRPRTIEPDSITGGPSSPAGTAPEGVEGLRPGLLRLLQRSSLVEKKTSSLHQEAGATWEGEGDHLVILTGSDVAELHKLSLPVAVLVRGARQEPVFSDSAHNQESSFYKSEHHSAAGLQVVGFNASVQSLLSVKSQQEYLLHLREQLFLHPRLGLVVEDAFSRLLTGESGCAQLPTPPALQQYCPFSTLHFLTCLYKAGEGQPAVRCAVLLYGAREAGNAAQATGAPSTQQRSHIDNQATLLSEISPHILTMYDLEGTVLHQNNASIAFLGNQTSFISSLPPDPTKRDSLRALFQLSPGRYDDMIGGLRCQCPTRDFFTTPQSQPPRAMLSLSTEARQALQYLDGMTCSLSACSVAGCPPEVFVEPLLYHDITASCVRDIVLGRTQIMLTQVDVTEQVRRERELQELVFAEEKLLESVFPRHVIEELTQRVTTVKPNRLDQHMATSHEEVTILFADLVGFTSMSEMMTPQEVMLLLNRLYTALDELLDVYGVYKVETIGDCYVVAGGLMLKDQDDFHAVRRASLGVCPNHANSTMMFAKPLRLRVGMHTGPVMSGVVGTRMPRFCLFGDTINTASRMESTSQPGCIHISAATHKLLCNGNVWRPTGGVQVKGKGLMETYFWVPGSVDEAERLEEVFCTKV
ncbi:MAG: hypothetical protein WDW36_009928 [Sanguina aurantia]